MILYGITINSLSDNDASNNHLTVVKQTLNKEPVTKERLIPYHRAIQSQMVRKIASVHDMS